MAFIVSAAIAASCVPAVAQALPPSCATAPNAIVDPDPLTDTDRLVRELRAARIENAATCAALAERLDAIAQADSATSDDVDALRVLAAGDGLATVEQVDPAAPDPGAQAVTLSEDDRGWLAGSITAQRADVWVLVGVLCGLFLVGFLIRRDA